MRRTVATGLLVLIGTAFAAEASAQSEAQTDPDEGLEDLPGGAELSPA